METATKNEIVNLDPAEYGLDSKKALQVAELFQPMLDKMIELEVKFNDLNKLEMSEEKCRVAKELRLQYVKVRTGTAKIHQELKSAYLAGGRFVDGWKNAQLKASGGIEETLKGWEEHYEREIQAKIDKLQEERAAEIAKTDMPVTDGLGEMEEDVWKNLITGARASKQARLDAEEKAEADRKAAEEKAEKERLEAERKAKEEQEKVEAENARLKKEADEAEVKRKAVEKKNADAHKAAVAAQEAETKKQEAKLKAEREEREKVEAELKAKEEAEEAAKRKAIEEAHAAKQAELQKDDGGRLTDLSIDLKMLKEKYVFESDDYKHLYMRVGAFIDRLRNEIEDSRDVINSKSE